ncbi:hypothetical protein F4561_002481 [Lipingzhangella halophila]|uniref:Uncharacterized protein n=1 Tax=Lipingzhangella halophila TaxID=1783352 RepID=A0A7W7RHP1_9ACTN|nr:hypothetical protein [Lipingzhangella halophila]MBB4931661.1 hypothetical protein [Lipingzhangella halophila]
MTIEGGGQDKPERSNGQVSAWGVTYAPKLAQSIAADTTRTAARAKNYPPDLINAALERLVEAPVELPGFTTLDELAATIRAEVNREIFAGICERLGEEGRARLAALVAVGEDGLSMFKAHVAGDRLPAITREVENGTRPGACLGHVGRHG